MLDCLVDLRDSLRELGTDLVIRPPATPLVDGGMHQHRRDGGMHNRARLVVGSFLTKDLGIDWRWGERWLMRLLIDTDEANNKRQLAVDRIGGRHQQPVSRWLYNPTRHMERFDRAATTCAATCRSCAWCRTPAPARAKRERRGRPRSAMQIALALSAPAEYHGLTGPVANSSGRRSGSTPTRDQRDEATHY
jgi:hypothetical protein